MLAELAAQAPDGDTSCAQDEGTRPAALPENEPIQLELTSKNQLKKLRRQQRMEEKKRAQREADKAVRQAKQEQRRAEGVERMAVMSEEEKQRWRDERRAKVEARKAATEEKKGKLMQALQGGQQVVVDLDFEGCMSEGEMKSLCQQLGYAYGENTRAQAPCHLIMTSMKGRIAQLIRKQLSGFSHWVVTSTEDDYMAHFSGRQDQLVYLTADSPHEIHELDPGKAYIIGGLVDRNRHKGICFTKAQEQGIATARLPIGDYMKLASSQVMTTNHVIAILLRWLELRDWEAAFNAVIPQRKRKHEGEGEGGAEGAAAQQPAHKAGVDADVGGQEGGEGAGEEGGGHHAKEPGGGHEAGEGHSQH